MTEPRIGDDDREAAVAQLREAFAEGRLDQEEFEQRVKVATRAKVGSDLEPVLIDLPNASVPAAREASGVDALPLLDRNFWTRTGAGPVLVGAVVCTAIYAMTDWGGYFWPMWVWLGVFVTVLIALFGDD